jgi:hypothetical protein
MTTDTDRESEVFENAFMAARAKFFEDHPNGLDDLDFEATWGYNTNVSIDVTFRDDGVDYDTDVDIDLDSYDIDTIVDESNLKDLVDADEIMDQLAERWAEEHWEEFVQKPADPRIQEADRLVELAERASRFSNRVQDIKGMFDAAQSEMSGHPNSSLAGLSASISVLMTSLIGGLQDWNIDLCDRAARLHRDVIENPATEEAEECPQSQ